MFCKDQSLHIFFFHFLTELSRGSKYIIIGINTKKKKSSFHQLPCLSSVLYDRLLYISLLYSLITQNIDP